LAHSSILHPRSSLPLLGVLLFAAATFLTGIDWGLPTRGNDQILFGGRTPWTGDRIMELAGAWDEGTARGADIAMHPLPGQRSSAIVVNDTDAKRAEIVRRYRLYSCQPDEMITFRSLSRMKPGRLDLDPRLYQYGGLWIYPIGGLLKIASLLHLLTLRTDLAFYLDHPEQFARFYVVARFYAAAWGLLGVLVVFAIGREWTRRSSGGIAAAGVFASLPVVINLAHEAKPHLPGAVLVLLTAYLAALFVRSGKTRWWILAGISAGAATGMVLTGYIAFAPLAVMVLLRQDRWIDRFRIAALAGLIGILTFAITNPYLPYNLLLHRQVLHSNVGNYGTFYQPTLSWGNIAFSGRCIIAGLSPFPALAVAAGLLAGIWFKLQAPGLRYTSAQLLRNQNQGKREGAKEREESREERVVLRGLLRALFAPSRLPSLPAGKSRQESEKSPNIDEEPDTSGRSRSWAVALLLAAPATLVLVQFVLLARGKTAEYARFALVPDAAMAIAAVAAVHRLRISARERIIASVLLVAGTLFFGMRYDLNFLADIRDDSTRRIAALAIERQKQQCDQLVTWAEPAPYCMPAVDLFHWQIVLLPAGSTQIPKDCISVRPVDYPDASTPEVPERASSPISWANKPMHVELH
jgi:hypothetical protein